MKPGTIPAARTAYAYRARFTRLWQAFIHETFPSARKAAQFFSVDERTARGWWHGTHGPHGHVVGMAFMCLPDAAARHFIVDLERLVTRVLRAFLGR